MRKPAVWTASKNEQLRSLCLTNLSNSEIATVMVTTTDAIKRQKRRLGIPPKPARTPIDYRIAALTRMIRDESYEPRKGALRVRLLNAMADKHGVRRLGVGGQGR